MMKVVIRQVNESELKSINDIISACVFNWNLSERVKRLTVSSYQYNSFDLTHFEIYAAIDTNIKTIVGVMALETAKSSLPEGQTGLLLHGLYVAPIFQKQQIGQQLLEFALQRVKTKGLDGLLVKAQVEANRYFEKQGFEHLSVVDVGKDYPHRWWRKIK
jgi:N-acetylglutamate synthase-like GNAT family acetyltransferase